MTAHMALNSVITSGDTTRFTVTKTPKGKELTYTDLNYGMALDDNGTRLLLGGTRVATNPLFVLTPVHISGINYNYYSMVNFPVIRSRSENLTFRAGFNYVDTWVTAFNQKLYTDHLRNLDIGGTYNFADRWYGSNNINADLRQGLPLFGYTQDFSLNAQTSRPGGHAVYTKIAAQYSRLQAIKGPWSLFLVLQGQQAFSALLASEQFTFGGSVIGRGYDVAELIGDRGMSGSLELRYDWNISKFKLQTLQLYGFYDAGMVLNYYFVGGTPRKVTGTTTGLGVRFYFNKYVSGNLMWTQTLTKQVAAEELIGDGRKPRTWFSIVAMMD
jgi:hemolysin activation/secretion protein